MKTFFLSLGLIFSSCAFAVPEFNSANYSCQELRGLISQYGRVFVRQGIGGRSFAYPPNKCGNGEIYASIYFRDKNNQSCLLDYACVIDPRGNR